MRMLCIALGRTISDPDQSTVSSVAIFPPPTLGYPEVAIESPSTTTPSTTSLKARSISAFFSIAHSYPFTSTSPLLALSFFFFSSSSLVIPEGITRQQTIHHILILDDNEEGRLVGRVYFDSSSGSEYCPAFKRQTPR